MAGALALATGALGPVSAVPVRAALWIQAVGVGALGVAGAIALLGGESAGGGFTGAITVSVGIDPLTGLFLAILGIVGVPAALYASGYVPAGRAPRAIAALGGGFQLAMVGVLVARDVATFLACWELMSLLPAAAILAARADAEARRAVFVYLAITHVGGAAAWVAVLTLAGSGVIDDPGALSGSTATVALIAASALVGFGTKAGLAPLHAWLPRAHPIAPSHLSALMSGVMTKVAIYGLVRVFADLLPDAPGWCGPALLVAGGVSALGGILFALAAGDLKRLLAFSTIENVGIVALGLGAWLVLEGRGEQTWAALALAAALLHAVNHAASKGLLFMAAGSIERAGAGRALDRMGGLLGRMPLTAGATLIGLTAIAGLPPLGGFASEWLTLRALAELPIAGSIGSGILGALALAMLAAAAAVGVLCFTAVAGLALLGPARRPEAAAARDVAPSMRAGVAILAGVCVALGAVPGLLVPALADIAPGGATPTLGPGLDLPGAGALHTLALMLALAAGVGALAAVRGRRAAAPAPVWACGQPVGPELGWTGAAFAKPLVLTLAGALRPEREVVVEDAGGAVRAVRHRSRIPQLLDERVLAPGVAGALSLAGRARRLQSGSLRAYVGYLAGLVLLLLVLARTGVLS